MKYSALAIKVIFRGTAIGKNMESENDRWLLAIRAAPSAGTFSRPSTQGWNVISKAGPIAMFLRNL
jgi:hypothetical protein